VDTSNILKNTKSVLRGRFQKKKPYLIVFLLILAILVVFLWHRIVITAHVGEAGVLFRRFTGTEVDKIYKEGVHIISPLDIMTIYETRNQIALHEFDVLSVKGLRIHLAIAIRYRPQYDMLPTLHQRIGPEYLQRVVLPQIESVMRKQLGRYNADQIYTNENGLLNKAIVLAINEVGRNYVEVDDVIIRSLTLPDNIVKAIEDKLTQQEYLRSYEFRLKTAAQEAQRKISEARGIHQAQRIISESLTPEILAFEGIKATQELAKSQNAKIVVIGSGKNGLPLILGDKAFSPDMHKTTPPNNRQQVAPLSPSNNPTYIAPLPSPQLNQAPVQ
jgi:regulator of protease activity HflC (stomatin/prohibitin superfamily)